MKSVVSLFRKNIAFFVGAPAVIWQLLFVFIPIVMIFLMAFSGPTLLAYIAVFFKSVYVRIIVRSLVMALCNAIICLCIAYPLTYFLVFQAGFLKVPLLFLAIVPFWTNFLLHVYAWFFVLDRGGLVNVLLQKVGLIAEPLQLLNTTGATLLMMVYFYMPFTILPLYSMLERFDQRLLEASADLGATWWQSVTRILLPETLPGIRAAFFLVFVPSFGEFAIPEFMGGERTMYVGTVITQFVLGAQTTGFGAAFTLLSVAALILASAVLYSALTYIFLRRKW